MSAHLISLVRDKIIIPVATLIGKAADVEMRLDVYKDYYATKLEVVDPKSFHPAQVKIFEWEGKNANSGWVLMTAVQKNGSQLKQREFLVKKSYLERHYAFDLSGKIGATAEKPQVLSNYALSITTCGQYLGSWAPLRPRIQYMERKFVPSAEIDTINALLLTQKPSRGLDFHYQAPKAGGQSPK